MPQKNAQDRLWKILTPVLLVLSVLAMAKTLFVGLEIDEEYAFSLGFRLVKGDRLFYTMWEPHQLSALPAALVLALYTAIAGTTTGALLFVRAVVLVCKAAMSAVFYRDFKQTIGRHGALLSAVVLFVYTPKWFLGPGLYQPAVLLHRGGIFVLLSLLHPWFPPPMAGSAGGGVRLLQLSGVPAKRTGGGGDFYRHGVAGPPRQGADDL